MAYPRAKESHTTFPKLAALKTGVDKSEKFGVEISQGVDAAAIRWEGFLKCKRVATYTFLFQKPSNYSRANGYSVKINGQLVIPGNLDESSCDVNLKVGWNKVEIVAQFCSKSPLKVSFRPKGSLAEPRPLTPAMMFHDQKPEYVW